MSVSDPRGSERKKPLVVNQQAREMAKRILELCVEEKKAGNIFFTVNDALDRAARYTGLSKKMLISIQRDAKKGTLRSPSRKGKLCNKKNNINVSCFDRGVVHRCIEEFYLTKKIVPTCSQLLLAIREKIHFPWKATSLRKLLNIMGYQWLKCNNRKRPILFERPEIMFARSNYLRNIREHRESDHKIFFLVETLLDKNISFKKCWKNNLTENMLMDTSSTYKLLIVCASSRSNFLNAEKVLFKICTTKGNNDTGVNSVYFRKWCTEMLIPNLPAKSVIIIDSASCQNSEENEIPTKTSTKGEMIDWLAKRNMKAFPTMRKDELFQLIESHNPKTIVSKTGELIQEYGYEILKLPPYMCELNPIEAAWTKIKDIVKEHKIHSDLSIEKIRKIIEMSIQKITNKDWNEFDEHVIACETDYWNRDMLMENTLDTFVVEVNNDEDSNSDSPMSGFDSDSDSLFC